MLADIYEQLAEHLDSLPAGFPRTESGVELRILRRLFTPEETRLALHLTLLAEEPRVIAYRADIPMGEVTRRLEEMDKKGLIFSIRQDGKPPRYQIEQFVVGFWEGQLQNLSPELVRDFEEYLPSCLDADVWRSAPQMRTIPVRESVTAQTVVMPYEQAESLLRAHEIIAVTHCICRQEQRTLDRGCDRPSETCLAFGMVAEHAVRIGHARAISQEEALAIVRRAGEAGLVLQPTNAREPLFLCACCGCCCGVLRSLKRHPQPATLVSSAFVATIDRRTCVGCGMCQTRCQMEALALQDGVVVLDRGRCIGCGLCVTTCPTRSVGLVRKPGMLQPYVPRNIVESYIRTGRARGKMGLGQLASLAARSLWDRMFAPR